jgi:hypothetical protein
MAIYLSDIFLNPEEIYVIGIFTSKKLALHGIIDSLREENFIDKDEYKFLKETVRKDEDINRYFETKDPKSLMIVSVTKFNMDERTEYQIS